MDGIQRIQTSQETERRFAAGEIFVQQREVEHAENVAGMAGGWLGAWGGMKVCAMGGGAVGSIFPGPGTAVGGTLGGVTGGVAGYFGGEKAAQSTAEWSVKTVHASGRTIGRTATSAWSHTKNATNATGNAARRAWNWATDW